MGSTIAPASAGRDVVRASQRLEVALGKTDKSPLGTRTLLWRVTLAVVLVAGATAVLIGQRVWSGWRYRPVDGVAANFLLAVFGDDTAYARGYSEGVFMGLRSGMSTAHVLDQLGAPLYRTWDYPVRLRGPNPCCWVVLGGDGKQVVRASFDDAHEGMMAEAVLAEHGQPAEESWVYAGRSEAASDPSYRVRKVTFHAGVLDRVVHEVNVD